MPRAAGKQVSSTGMTFSNPTQADQPATLDYLDRKLLMRAGWGAGAAAAAAATRFLAFMSNTSNPLTTELSSFFGMPIAGTVVRMYVNVVTPLTTNTVTFTLRKNGVNTAATVVLPAATNQVSLLGQAISFAAGDRLSIAILQSSTEAQANWSCSVALAYAATEVAP